jgi:ferritin-like metal-binding protein YciE
VTAEVAHRIGGQERAMMERLARGFDAAERASHGDTPPSNMPDAIRKHLTEAHALAIQGIQLLKKSETIAGNTQLAHLYNLHLEHTHDQVERVEERLEALDADPSTLKDLALQLGAVNWGWFFQAQSDTPAKLAAFVYAFEHLEIAGYELLRRSAQRAGDHETEMLCESAIAQIQHMADQLACAFDSAVEATLHAEQSVSTQR